MPKALVVSIMAIFNENVGLYFGLTVLKMQPKKTILVARICSGISPTCI